MIEELEAEDFLNRNIPIIDVRSPAEFAQGHIPNAINIPIFDDQQRAIVGTLYKNNGKETAIEKGLEIVGHKMSQFVIAGKKIALDKKVFIHCWRGGMRSKSFAWLLQTATLTPTILSKGYKNYRNYVINYLKNINLEIIILGGNTGSGKTQILLGLKEKGQQIIDLEGIANHKGSVFGGIEYGTQPTNEQFENNLVHLLSQLDHSKPIWVEAESRMIGNICLPSGLWETMKKSNRININIDINIRIERLVKEYGSLPAQKLIDGVKKIEVRMGNQSAKSAIEAINNNDMAECARLCLIYYDKFYMENLNNLRADQIAYFQVNTPEDLDYEALINVSKKLNSIY